MALVDEAKINVTGGAGGNGALAFHREPYKPRGGPDGGNGGRGGNVVIRADDSVGTLLELRDHPHVKAESGKHGEGNRKHGADAPDRVVLVPPGTMIYDGDVLVADLAGPGDEFLAARGGRGGRGNASFATATRRAPGFAEKGEPGDERWLRLELRLLADVGLVGFPNAGKSTLISRISAARPKIADYPFTTLEPNLGVVRHDDDTFVVADIPGLVPGAHEGKGLGDRFLRHVSRSAVLLFLVDLAATDRDPAGDVAAMEAEVTAFDAALGARPRIVAATKADVAREVFDRVRERHPDAHLISAVTGEGIDVLLALLTDTVGSARSAAPRAEGYVRHVVRDEPIRVLREGQSWRVRGRRAEGAVARTDLDSEEAVTRLQRKLISIGVERMLAESGAKRGDEVRIGEIAFTFEPESEEEK
ncbi:MAG TPA: GTPase ObgE [Actinomycetota bacterium]|nr:GTPase ObgE [Actinomycetota bacterium]